MNRLARLACAAGAGKIAVVAAFLLADRLFPFPMAALRPPPAVVVADRAGEPLRMFLPPDEQWRLPVRLADVPPALVAALIATEDRWFHWHPGVNPVAIVRAAWDGWRAGHVVSGASTIAMQVARLAEPRPRTVTAKMREAFRALQLRWHLRSDELLEAYLNLAPYGGNVQGIGAAAWFWFGKRPARLSLGEVAVLAALPRSPVGHDPARRPEATAAARERLLDRLVARRVVGPAAAAEALRQPIPAARRRPPLRAPHLAQLVAARWPGAAVLDTTLDLRLQRLAEERVAERIVGLRAQGVGNAAVVVIETGPRALRAMVGSAGFFETAEDGQVNGAVARRSPGSALKPFLYALAIDRGLIVPDSFLLDVPTDFGGYVADNFDGQYRGRVTVREALAQSLNAAAVRLLAQVGVEDFHAFLRRGGLATLDRPPRDYGLPLVLGSGEVTLLDLTNLYATLADGGRHRPVALLRGAPPAGEQLVSPEAAHLVAEMLTALRRPDLPRAWDRARGVPTVAWKTGTSYGHRDAWALGFSRRYAIGVWVGNMDGRARKGISGAEHAAPLLFDLFRVIDPDDGPLAPPAGLALGTTEVCAVSHERPGPSCTERIRVTTIAGRSRLATCTYHRRVLLDGETGEQLVGDCVATRPHREATVTVYPPELVAWWRQEGQPVPGALAVSPACRVVPSDEPPRIVSPAEATPYRVRRDAPLAYQQVPLVAQTAAAVGTLWWYQDGALVASGPPRAPLFVPPSQGTHRLVVVDGTGRSDSVTYRVE